MTFERADKRSKYYVDDIEKYTKFLQMFNIVGVHWNEPTTISASYFLRLLKIGSSARTHIDKHNNSKSGIQFSDFREYLLDHPILWKQDNGNVICTAMPYGTHEDIKGQFNRLIETFSYPSTLKLVFLDDEYHFRNTGTCMILIYFDSENEF